MALSGVLGVAILAGLLARSPLGRRFLWLWPSFLGFLFLLVFIASLVRSPARGWRLSFRSELLSSHSFGKSVTLRA